MTSIVSKQINGLTHIKIFKPTAGKSQISTYTRQLRHMFGYKLSHLSVGERFRSSSQRHRLGLLVNFINMGRLRSRQSVGRCVVIQYTIPASPEWRVIAILKGIPTTFSGSKGRYTAGFLSNPSMCIPALVAKTSSLQGGGYEVL